MGASVDYLVAAKGTGRLSFRRTIPVPLRPYVPGDRTELKRSLGSYSIGDPKGAAIFAAASKEYDRLVSLARKAQAREYDPLESPMIAYLVECFRLQLLKKDEDRRTGLIIDPWNRADRALSNDLCLDELRSAFWLADHAQFVSQYADHALELAQAEGLNIDPAAASFRQLCSLLQEAEYRAFESIVARDNGKELPTLNAAGVPASRPAASPKPSGKTLDDLITGFQADRQGEGVWSKSMDLAYAPVFRLLRAVVGSDRPLPAVTRDDGRAIRSYALALPVNVTKLKVLKGLSLLDAIEKGNALGLPTLAPKTINDAYLAQAGAVFNWGVRERWIDHNPIADLRVKDPVPASKKRDPFTIDQLQTIFTIGPWEPNATSPRRPVYYWAALLALFHGIRRAEIMQLSVADIETRDGIVLVHVRGERLKNESAIRTIPLHSELHRMGFMAFVVGQQSAGASLLFPGEGPSPKGQWGDGYSKWFKRLTDPLALKGVKLGFHSFRHSFQDAIRRADLQGTAIAKEITGRDKGSETSDSYGSRFSDAALVEAMAKIAYKGLDLSHLYRPG